MFQAFLFMTFGFLSFRWTVKHIDNPLSGFMRISAEEISTCETVVPEKLSQEG
jgi:hypothetical protein